MPTLVWLSDGKGRAIDEADVSAEPAPSGEGPRVPGADEDQGRAQGPEAATGEGTQTADRLTGRFFRHERLTRAADFQVLFQQGKRVDGPSLIVLWREAIGSRKVGFAVSRQVRGSVKRNRAKRRLREAYRAARTGAPSNIAMVVVGRPGVLTVGFESLIRDMREAFGMIPGPHRAA
jgi:ribonuclease P protein component